MTMASLDTGTLQDLAGEPAVAVAGDCTRHARVRRIEAPLSRTRPLSDGLPCAALIPWSSSRATELVLDPEAGMTITAPHTPQPDVDLREPIRSGPRQQTPMQSLASAYAERLSCIRCGASDVELAQNARLIADLERRCRDEERARRSSSVPVAPPGTPATSQSSHTVYRLDSELYLG
jgi:hypothetical protein